jgi:hypothetical protein
MKTQHQNLEFGHKLGQIQNKPEKSTLGFKGGKKLRKASIFLVNKVSSCLSFFLSASTAVAAYIFTAPICTVTITTLESSALNAEFQHFVPRFNKISFLCGYH